ncbi:MAG: aminodeoxychorismate synthase component I [Spirochaetales bacterium]|nr:aminodeoxychorismate synthase component I [Spirochaetales bacterium]
MYHLTREQSIAKMNDYGGLGIPFLFIIDFSGEMPIVLGRHEILDNEICFDFNGIRNCEPPYLESAPDFLFEGFPIHYAHYKRAFDVVMRNFIWGNSFLLNLTFPTPVLTDMDFRRIFAFSNAKYRLYIKNQLVVFSPESFVRIDGDLISSFPMKGTIDASISNARQVILDDPKETAEHITIVDLVRNDIGMIADHVHVRRFRYIDTLETSEKTLLQVSSEVCGLLHGDFRKHIGTLLFRMLPAGSISGAPKKKTVEIIREAEGYNRGYYTGVCGWFDGVNLDSGVMIRYLERTPDGTILFKSGGGLTVYSDPVSEYQELIDKVYVPFSRDSQSITPPILESSLS